MKEGDARGGIYRSWGLSIRSISSYQIFPAGGYWGTDVRDYVTTLGNYWSTKISTSSGNLPSAYILYFYNSDAPFIYYSYSRRYGTSIRSIRPLAW